MSLNNTIFIIQDNINLYLCSTLVVLGTIGCLLNILLFSQKQFRTISCCLYFRSASISMIIALIATLTPYICSTFHQDLSEKYSSLCKIRGYVAQSSAMTYRWLMTMACIDRYISTTKNSRLKKLINVSNANKIIVFIEICFLIIPIHNLFGLTILQNICTAKHVYYMIYHSILTFSVGAFFPLLIMCICLKLIQQNLAKKRIRLMANLGHSNSSNDRFRLINSRDQQVLLMLYVQILFYTISNIPWMIFLFYTPYIFYARTRSINQIIITQFMKYLTQIIICFYPTFSFYVYTLTSRTFRYAFMNLF